MSLDPETEITELQTENDYLKAKLAMAEEKLRNTLASLYVARAEADKLDKLRQTEREEFLQLMSSVEEGDLASD